MSNRYAVLFTANAESYLKCLDKHVANYVLEKLNWLSEHASFVTHHPVSDWLNEYYRFRVGAYCIFYRLDRREHSLVVEIIGHRRDIYGE